MRTVLITLSMLFMLGGAVLQAQSLTGHVRDVTVARGDTLRVLGSRFGVDPSTIAEDNGRKLDAPLRIGETLRIDNRHVTPAFDAGVSIIVNVPQRMLFTGSDAGVIAYPVAVGRADWQTPLGAFVVVNKETDPTWDVPASIREEARRAGKFLPLRVPPGPRNPLGRHWLGLSVGGVGIHGTNAPASLYQAVTHGCVRLHAEDIAALYGHVQVGTVGRLSYEPVLVAVEAGNVFVEAHRDIYRLAAHDGLEFVRARARELGVVERVDWELAAAVIRQRAGVARLVTR